MLNKINGMSLKKYCRINGLNYATVRYRLSKGMSLEQASKPCYHRFIERKYGRKIYERVRRGRYTLEEALSLDFDDISSEKNGRKKRKEYTIKGRSFRQFCIENGYSYEYALAIMSKKGLTTEEVIDYFEKRNIGKRNDDAGRGEEEGSC